jgi:hypothetical protein
MLAVYRKAMRQFVVVGTLLCASVFAHADDSHAWQSLATQTCVSQAPSNPYISQLKMPASQLQYTCGCVVRDVYQKLSPAERESLLQQMRQRQNMRAVGERIFARPDVKSTALTCSAKSFWQ